MEATGDHQVEYQELIFVKDKHDPFAHALKTMDLSSMDGFNGRVRRTKKKRTGKTNLFKALFLDKGLESLDVDGDIGVFRHTLLLMVVTIFR
jgi:hypothetical protein